MQSFVGLCILLGLGHWVRTKLRTLQMLYLPSCVIGGLLGLVVLQVGRVAGYPLPAAWTAGWSALPGLLINVVFACLFLGVTLPKLSELWRIAGLQFAYGQLVAWGQYVVGIGLVLAFLGPMFGLPDLFGGILPVGFEGGHGTAAGLAPVFTELGWDEGRDFALAAATGGILGAILVGMALVNWAVRRGYTEVKRPSSDLTADESAGFLPVTGRPVAGHLTVNTDAVESLSLHLVIVGLAILIGILFKEGLLIVEAVIPGLAQYRLLASFPLFPLCMLGGVLIQWWEDNYDRHDIIDLGLMRRIQNAALDFLVIAAIATIRLEVVATGLAPLMILIVAGILWNVFCVMFLARRVFSDAWFERSIAEMGQSMGVTATGLLLLRVVDPDYESSAVKAFAGKQLLHEPIMGGGLWTGAAIPLIAVLGGLPVLGICAAAMLFWVVVIFGRRLARR